ncbi:MAG: ARPP-1 family domain-containing protein, partial [Terriglobales bacterium]
MNPMLRTALALTAAAAAVISGNSAGSQPSGKPDPSGYRVLEPISQGNLTIFPVVSGNTFDTSRFLTLDEGLASGEVVVTEAGRVRPLMRRRPQPVIEPGGGDVNRLLLINNSSRPLLLLAGEIVTGGKQDRVVGKDRIIPAASDPVDLGVFCVEPGRWTETSARFQSLNAAMAQPSVRAKAMGDKDQQKVWEEVRRSQAAMSDSVNTPGTAGGRAAAEVSSTTSYARVMNHEEVKKRVDEAAAPLLGSHRELLRRLRAQNAVGVLVAVNGRILWADLFASRDLLAKYWEKLVRSYAAEAVTAARYRGSV